MTVEMTPGQQAQGSILGALSTLVCSTLVVLFPWAWFDSLTRFGFGRADHVIFLGGTFLALVGIAVGVRAHLRFVVQNEGDSEAPLLTRLVPLLIVAGMAFGGYMGLSVHQQRYARYAGDARSLCAEVLCPGTDAWTEARTECLRQHPSRTRCEEIAWDCQRRSAGLEMDARRRAETRCVQDAALDGATP